MHINYGRKEQRPLKGQLLFFLSSDRNASPLYADLHGLPPLLIYVGEEEILRDDSTQFAAKAKAAGVDVTLRVGEGMFHCYPATAPLYPEAIAAMQEICTFIQRILKV